MLRSIRYGGFSIFEVLRKSPINAIKYLIIFFLEKVGLSYRTLFPHKANTPQVTGAPIYSNSSKAEELQAFVKAPRRFEHLISNSSPEYLQRRHEIANRAYELPAKGSKK